MEEQVIPAEQTADTTADLEAEALAAAPQKRRINRAVLSENLWGWFFVCFLVIGTTLFIYLAFVLSVWLSFVDYRGNGTLWEALGEGNSSGAFYWYQYMFSNTMPGYFGSVAPGGIANFGTTLLNTIFYLIGIPVGMALSLFFAALMSRDIKGSGVFRVIYYIPTVASTVSVALLWENLFGGSTTGGSGGTMVQLFGTNFIKGDRWMRMLTVLILTTWKGLGGSILLLCAGMNASTRAIRRRRLSTARTRGRPSGASRCRSCGRRSSTAIVTLLYRRHADLRRARPAVRQRRIGCVRHGGHAVCRADLRQPIIRRGTIRTAPRWASF